jgi:class 3 adenylate cyclase
VGEEVKAVVFTPAPRKLDKIRFLAGPGALDLEVRPLKELKKALPSLEVAPLVYVHVQGLTAKEAAKLLAVIEANPRVRFCVLDPAGEIGDVASVFHAGAVDYIGKAMASGKASAKRRRAPLEYAKRIGAGPVAASPDEVSLEAQVAVRDGWAEIEPGREHSFAFLFIEVDDAEELKKRHEPENLAAAMATFKEFIERNVDQHGGRLWMWSRFGGLVLFPLHDPAPYAPMCGLRILLSSIFYDAEESLLPGRLSFRMALSAGSTVYHEGDTGRIVSDAVNSIFHLGRRFTRSGQFLITADAYDLVPQQARGFFHAAGTYEGRRIYRMLRPSSATGMHETGSAWSV